MKPAFSNAVFVLFAVALLATGSWQLLLHDGLPFPGKQRFDTRVISRLNKPGPPAPLEGNVCWSICLNRWRLMVLQEYRKSLVGVFLEDRVSCLIPHL